MTGLKFQPYGVLPSPFKSAGLDENTVMTEWRPNLPQDQRIATFNAWRSDRLDYFADHIWPRFDFGSRQFAGKSTGFAEDLTEFEIDVMVDAFFGTPHILSTFPTAPLAVQEIEDHLQHYKYEDQNQYPPGVNYRQYDRTLTEEEERIFLRTMLEAISLNNGPGRKVAGHFWFKNQMQRPRPLHAAMAFSKEEGFVSELSERGQHPSIVSGHCLQGTIMACAVLEEWRKSDPHLSSDRINSLAQYMVDVGDRRVFAGVHYPTDNVASWALALSLIPEVFDDSAPILDFVRDAILNKSQVFQLIRDKFLVRHVEELTRPVINVLTGHGLDPRPAAAV
jgi:hypothetical protein